MMELGGGLHFSFGLALYQLMMATSLTAVVMAPAAAEGAMPGNISKGVFFWLGVLPSAAQMALTVYAPWAFWFNSLCYLALAVRYRNDRKRGLAGPPAKPYFQLPDKLYGIVFFAALPLCAADVRFFLPVLASGSFALWCFQRI